MLVLKYIIYAYNLIHKMVILEKLNEKYNEDHDNILIKLNFKCFLFVWQIKLQTVHL